MADEKKTILFDVQVQATQAIKEMQAVQTALDQLKIEHQKLVGQLNSAEYGSEKYKQLQQQVIANEQAQKAYRKELTELSRGVQNTLISQSEKYTDTLRAKAAQLSVEKDLLRQIKNEEGKLSDAYIKQRQVVKELSDEVTQMERDYGTHSRNVGNYESAWSGMLGRLRIGWVAFFAAIGKGLKEFAEDFINETQRLGDAFRFEVEGWKEAYHQFIIGLQRGDGWSDLINNMEEAYRRGKELAFMLDELFERQNSLRIEEAKYATENEQLKIDMRDRTKSDEERIAAAQKYMENETHLAEMRQDVANQELEANKRRLQERTNLNDEELKFYVEEYNLNKDAIRQAIEYNKTIREQEALIKAYSKNLVTPFGQVNSAVAAQIADAKKQISDLEANTSDGIKNIAQISAKYNMTNDELVTAYVESFIKAETVTSEMLRSTMRAQTTMHGLQAELQEENNRQAEKNAQEKKKRDDEELKRQEQALKAQEQALQSYGKTVTSVYNMLAESMMTDTERQVKAVKDQYYQQELSLREQVQNGMMSFEEATYWRVALAQMASDKIAKINEDAAEKERQDQLRADQQAAQDRQRQLQADLQIAWDNEDEKYRIRKQYLENELKLENLSAERRAELEQQLTELMKEHLESRLNMVMDYAQKLNDALGAIHNIQQNRADAELQDYESKQESEKAALEKKLNAGLISQKQYDERVAKLDKDLDAKKAQLAREQAEREREASLFSVALNTAQAIMKVWSEVPVVAAPAMTAVVATIGALQTAAILSQPLPKARRGGQVEGPTHEGGGVLVETEGGERIVAAQPARVFPELLNLISYIGKHAGIPDTGYAARNMIGGGDLDYDKIKEAMKEAVAEVQVYLALTELRDAQQTQVQIEALAKQ